MCTFESESSSSLPVVCFVACKCNRAQELCESRGGRPGLSVPNSPYRLCRRLRAQEVCESRGGRSGLPVPNGLYGLCGRKACGITNYVSQVSETCGITTHI